MPHASPEQCEKFESRSRAVLELLVVNHPGVMAHVIGLFSRRAYNVEGIFCLPVRGGDTSRIFLLVAQEDRLHQMLKQVAKLEDVIQTRCHGAGHKIFQQLGPLLEESL